MHCHQLPLVVSTLAAAGRKRQQTHSLSLLLLSIHPYVVREEEEGREARRKKRGEKGDEENGRDNAIKSESERIR